MRFVPNPRISSSPVSTNRNSLLMSACVSSLKRISIGPQRLSNRAAHNRGNELCLMIDKPAHIDAIEIIADDVGVQKLVVEGPYELADVCKSTVFVKQRARHATPPIAVSICLLQRFLWWMANPLDAIGKYSRNCGQVLQLLPRNADAQILGYLAAGAASPIWTAFARPKREVRTQSFMIMCNTHSARSGRMSGFWCAPPSQSLNLRPPKGLQR